MENSIKEDKICEICKEKATNICFNCLSYLCDSCYKYIHDKTYNLFHQKEDIDSFISIDIKCPKHPQSSINLYCANEKSKIHLIYFYKYIELYCPICCLLQRHDYKHELNYISEEKSIENKDTLFEESVSNFEPIYERAKNMKQKLEKEIEGIEKMHKDVTGKLIKFFEDEHLNLNIKEKNAKKEIDEKVEEIKDELQNFLKESQDIFLSCENISNSIQAYKQNLGKSNMKTLYYISEINKNNEKVKELFQKPIKNINIIFPNMSLFGEKDNPRFIYYYLSGMPIAKNIWISKVDENAFIAWNIDELRFKYKSIKYSVEIKEEENENYTSYIVTEQNMLFKYKMNTNYEIKIRVIIDGSYGEYSDIKTFNEKYLSQFMNNSFSNLFGNPTYDNQSNTNNISSSGSLFGNNNNNLGSLISINLNDKKKLKVVIVYL